MAIHTMVYKSVQGYARECKELQMDRGKQPLGCLHGFTKVYRAGWVYMGIPEFTGVYKDIN